MTPPKSIVVIGASLGGLRAITAILEVLPGDFRPALAIAQHRRPDVGSTFVGLLAKACVLPVLEPDDKTPLRAGHVYLAPAGYHLMIENKVVALSVDEPVNFARPSIDVLFETAARAFRDAATGVLLTGSSEDGARGIAEIRRYGGRTIVQDPEDAESPIAPQAALRTGLVMQTLSLAEIGTLIASLSQP